MSGVFFPSTVEVDFTFKDYPSPQVVNYQLAQFEDYLNDTQALAEVAKEEAQADMATRFDTETDPDGHKWAALVNPAPEQIGILQLTGTMRDEAVSDDAWTATPVGVFFNTGALEPYWVYHEQPEEGGSNRGVAQRRFIGLDADTERKIQNRADEWLVEGINLGSRGFQRQRRVAAGRFGPKFTPSA